LFANWAALLQDFNEIDRYLLDSSYVYLIWRHWTLRNEVK
jgi:hypothetical protein